MLPSSKWWLCALTLDCVVNLKVPPGPTHLAGEHGGRIKILLTEGLSSEKFRRKAMFPVAQGKAPHSIASRGRWWCQGSQRLALGTFHNLNDKSITQTGVKKSPVPEANLALLLKRDNSAKISYSKSQFMHSFIPLFIHEIFTEPLLYEGHHARAKTNLAHLWKTHS